MRRPISEPLFKRLIGWYNRLIVLGLSFRSPSPIGDGVSGGAGPNPAPPTYLLSVNQYDTIRESRFRQSRATSFPASNHRIGSDYGSHPGTISPGPAARAGGHCVRGSGGCRAHPTLTTSIRRNLEMPRHSVTPSRGYSIWSFLRFDVSGACPQLNALQA